MEVMDVNCQDIIAYETLDIVPKTEPGISLSFKLVLFLLTLYSKTFYYVKQVHFKKNDTF